MINPLSCSIIVLSGSCWFNHNLYYLTTNRTTLKDLKSYCIISSKYPYQFSETFGCLSVLDETLVTSKTTDILESDVFFVSSSLLIWYLHPLQTIALWCFTCNEQYTKKLHNQSVLMQQYMEKKKVSNKIKRFRGIFD